MRLCRFSIFIFTYFTCLGLNPSYASIARNDLVPKFYEISQANSATNTTRTLLKLGNNGDDVKELQTQLKQLGYYNEVVDGQYGESTRIAVAKFQQVKSLSADGIAGKTTQNAILKAIKEQKPAIASQKPNSESNTEKTQSSKSSIIVWLLIAIAILGSLGTGVYFLKFSGKKQENIPQPLNEEDTAPENQKVVTSPVIKVHTDETPPSDKISDSKNAADDNSESKNNLKEKKEDKAPLVTTTHQTSHLVKIDIVERLIKDLQSVDPEKRRKAIWDLGQKGDSRAIKPMVNCIVHADSQQRSLILAALAEIGDRTLQPMKRAFAISMQDESPQVRQNAIRDITRIYDNMAQISQMLSYALEDSDLEVQETAKYALNQMNRICSLPANIVNSTPEVSQESVSEIRNHNSEFNNINPISFPELGNAHQNGNQNRY